MKTVKMGMLFVALFGTANAYALDKIDAGEYVLLNTQQEATTMQMRFYQNGTQWVMDAKNGNENWQSIKNKMMAQDKPRGKNCFS